jgi:hypothetical protein
MYRSLSSVLLATFIVASVPGASPKLTTTWKDPNVGKVNFSKIVIAFLTNDDDLRKRIEGGLARRIQRSVAANTIVADEDLKDRAAVKAHLEKHGIDGAIVVRLVDLKKDWVVSQGETWYAGLPGYWDTWDPGWLQVNTATYAFQDRVVTADIIVYSVATAKPVWAGRLRSTNPKDYIKGVLDQLVKEGAEELKKQKLI